jgi:hypothetical protein
MIVKHKHGTTITGESIELYALLTARQAMDMWIRSGGSFRMSRQATPSNIAKRFGIDGRTAKQVKLGIEKLIATHGGN